MLETYEPSLENVKHVGPSPCDEVVMRLDIGPMVVVEARPDTVVTLQS